MSKDSLVQDIPGFFLPITASVASVASNAANNLYQPIGIAPHTGTLASAYWYASASQAGDSSNYRNLALVNLGTTGTSATVLASHSLTASKAACVPISLNVVAGNSVTAGDLLAYVTTSAGNGVAVVAGDVTAWIK